jgi:hypothetical protein
MVEIPTPKPYIFMIRVTRQIKCIIAQAPGGHTNVPHLLPEVNFWMVEIPTLKPYIYSLFSYLLIKQDQMIMTCKPAVASLTQKSSLEGGGGVGPPRAWAIRFLICLVILIINIYGLGVGISTIKKFTSGRGWGMTPQGLSYKAFNLPSHPDHKYIWFKGGDLNH